VELGVGVGVAVADGVGLALGSGVGVGVAEVSVGLGLTVGEAEPVDDGGADDPDCEVLGLADGLLLAESDALGDTAELTEGDRRWDRAELAAALVLVETLAITTTLLGADAQVVLAVVVLAVVVLPVGAMATSMA
jgi:hypothetical protein